MATAKKTTAKTTTAEDKVDPIPETEPVTATFDIPTSEPSMDDFAKKVAPERKAVRATKRTSVDAELSRLRNELDRNVSIVAVAICMRDAWDGQLILANKDMIIDSWLEVAKVNPRFRTALLKLMDVGVYATAISNSLAMAVAVLAHHRMTPNPDFVLGAVGYTGLTMPDEDAVAQMEAMLSVMTNPDFATPNGTGDGS